MQPTMTDAAASDECANRVHWDESDAQHDAASGARRDGGAAARSRQMLGGPVHEQRRGGCRQDMKLIKCIIRPNKVEEVREALEKASVSGMTITEVRGHGRQKGHKAVYRGREYDVSLLPKTMIEMAVSDDLVDEVIDGRHEDGAHRRYRRRPDLGADDRGGLQHSDGGKRHVRTSASISNP